MPKKLKVYQTSVGFFDLAVAAPSMKAAAEAWQSDPDIFRRGFAKETTDAKVVAATLAAPGEVLRRPAGSDQAFSKHAALPKVAGGRKRPEEPVTEEKAAETKAEPEARSMRDEARDRAKREADEKRAALERKQAEAERKKAEAERAREQKRREAAIARLDATRERARLHHEETLRSIGKQRQDLDRDEARANEAWDRARKSYDDALKKLDA
jgi:colicin import membrane protein